jgi:hypothetical protein
MTRRRSVPRVPAAAEGVVQAARSNGWSCSAGWGLDSDQLPLYRVTVARPAAPGRPYCHAVLVWHRDVSTASFKIGNAVFRSHPQGTWETLPSLRILSNIMHTGAR